jgi:hypothetical protein
MHNNCHDSNKIIRYNTVIFMIKLILLKKHQKTISRLKFIILKKYIL